MTYNTTLTIKTDKKLKRQAKEYFSQQGINLSEAINTFFANSVIKDDGVILTEIDEKDLSPEVLASLDEMNAMKPEDFAIYENPNHAYS